jgi:hypothetical protein
MASHRVEARIGAQLKKYQPVLEQAKQKDISESDTCLIIRDLLCDVLGYKKFEDITTEHNIRGNFVDLAVHTDGKMRFLIEAKAIGITLKDQHVKQAVDYAANQGTDWVVLTNAAVWRLYKVIFSQPIDKVLVCEIDWPTLGAKNSDVIEFFGNISREEFSKDTMDDFLQRKEMSSKFVLAAVITTDGIIEQIRKEIRRLSGIRIDADYLRQTICGEVIKRELIDSDEGKAAQATVKRLLRCQKKNGRSSPEPHTPTPVPEIVTTEGPARLAE